MDGDTPDVTALKTLVGKEVKDGSSGRAVLGHSATGLCRSGVPQWVHCLSREGPGTRRVRAVCVS